MNENKNDSKIIRLVTEHLDYGTRSMPNAQVDRLRAARTQALGRQKMRRGILGLAGAGGHFHIDILGQRALAVAGAILVFALGAAYFHAQSYLHELEDVDSAILSDEMPMDAITDKGFDAWLRASGNR